MEKGHSHRAENSASSEDVQTIRYQFAKGGDGDPPYARDMSLRNRRKIQTLISPKGEFRYPQHDGD